MPFPDFRPSLHRPSLARPGLTTIELMVVLGIVAALAGIALPSFGAIIERARVRRASEELSAAIYLARSEALRRGGSVTLRKAAARDCVTSDDKDWSCGWLVFADLDNNGSLDPGEASIQSWAAPRGVRVHVTVPSPAQYLRVNRWGRFHNLGAFSFLIRSADSPSGAFAQKLCMSSAGRLQTLSEHDKC